MVILKHPYYRQIKTAIKVLLKSDTNHVLFISGSPGTGKSMIVKEVLNELNTKPIYIAHTSAEGLLYTIATNPDTVIVADDIDPMVFREKKMITLLKHLLDTKKERRIGWTTLSMLKRLKDVLDENNEIVIRNKVIFIVNSPIEELYKDQNLKAILSRIGTLHIEVKMNHREILETAKEIWGDYAVGAYVQVIRVVSGSDDIAYAVVTENALRGVAQFVDIVKNADDVEEMVYALSGLILKTERIRRVAEIKTESEAKMKGIPTYVYRHYKNILKTVQNPVRAMEWVEKVAPMVEEVFVHLKRHLKREDGGYKKAFKKALKKGHIKTPTHRDAPKPSPGDDTREGGGEEDEGG